MADEILSSASSDSLSTQVHDSEKKKESNKQIDAGGDLSKSRFYALYSYVAHRFQRDKAKTPENNQELSVSDFLQKEALTNGDFSLSVVSTNLSAEKETGLRKCLAHKISKGAVYSGTGSIIPLQLSLSEDTVMFSAQMYFNLLRKTDLSTQENTEKGLTSGEFVLCFLSRPEDGLELFQKDLDIFSHGLLHLIDAECWENVKTDNSSKTSQLTEINTGIRDYLLSWYEDAIQYVQDSVNLFQQSLKFLIYASMTGSSVDIEGADDRTKTLCTRFVECCSLVELLRSGQTNKHESSPVLVDLSDCLNSPQKTADKNILLKKMDDQYTCDSTDVPKFCVDWAEALLGGDNPSSASLRQIIESYKLKCIQDLNTLSRLIRLAESDYYALYRAYVFLKNSGNCKILLNYTQVEEQVSELTDAANVLTSLENFMKETGILIS